MNNLYRIADMTMYCNFITQLMKEMGRHYKLEDSSNQSDYSILYSVEELKQYNRYHKDLGLGQCEKIISFRRAFDAMVKMNSFMAHASVISVDGSGVAFCGNGGAGKTTQANLWLNHNDYTTELISDDRPILAMRDKRLIAWNTLWSHYQDLNNQNKHIELRAVCILVKSNKNKAREISCDKMAKLLSLGYPPDINARIEELLCSVLGDTPCYELYNSAEEKYLDRFRKEIKI